MDSNINYDDIDHDLARKSSSNGSSPYKRNVRSQSCYASPTTSVQRPQMRSPNGDVNIVDLTSDNEKQSLKSFQRRSKSVVTKPPTESKTRRLSRYLSKRVSVSSQGGAENSDSNFLPKSFPRKVSKADTSLHGCNEDDETISMENSPPDSLVSNESQYRPRGVRSSIDSRGSMTDRFGNVYERRESSSSNEKRDSSGSISPGVCLSPSDYPSQISPRRNPFIQYKNDIGDWRTYDLNHPRSSFISNEKFDLSCKVVLLGDSGVGKTCLLMKFKDGHFLSGSYISTVGVDFRNKVVDVDDSRVKLQIWDTAGQERFRSVTHAYYRDAHALLLLYDVGSKTSFDNTRAWLAEVHEYAQDDVVIMLIANKCDTSYADRQIRKEDGERLAREYNVAFMETSAKTGLNVDLAFTAIARDLKARKSKNKFEKRFNVSEYVQREAKSPPCACSLG